MTPDRRTLLALALGSLAAACAHRPTTTRTTPHPVMNNPPVPPLPGDRQVAQRTESLVTLKATLRHWLYLPAGYADNPSQRWPLIVFLHGSGERGHDLGPVKAHGLPKLLDAGLSVPAIVVSPQCEPDHDWDPHLLHGLLDALKQQHRVDARRVTATGLSMGGAGCWDWASAYPGDLAGIAPVCGFGRGLRVARMRDVPVRAYHGDQDDVVPLKAQEDLVAALRSAGGTATLTVYPGVGHDAWTPAYADPGLLPWLLARTRA